MLQLDPSLVPETTQKRVAGQLASIERQLHKAESLTIAYSDIFVQDFEEVDNDTSAEMMVDEDAWELIEQLEESYDEVIQKIGDYIADAIAIISGTNGKASEDLVNDLKCAFKKLIVELPMSRYFNCPLSATETIIQRIE